jgi:putative transposase
MPNGECLVIMRSARIKEAGGAYYHVISRVIERRMIMDQNEQERLRKTMRAIEAFSGVQILAFTILSNHFHVLLHVPDRIDVSDEELIRRLAFIYDPTLVDHVNEHLQTYRKDNQNFAADELKRKYTYRMYDLSEFMKTLKQRISQSYNCRHARNGTLWEGRFKSMLIQGSYGSLAAVAAYIDLNAVRAGIVGDPKDYRFCGYSEAVAGQAQARAGLAVVMESLGQGSDWDSVSAKYRELLYITGQQLPSAPGSNPPRKAGFDPQAVRQVLQANGKLPLPELLHCRVRYFSDGLVLGTKSFVEDVFSRHRHEFGQKRTSGARVMQGGFTDLFTARRLRLNVITPPDSA